jgi:hypothetical protein
MDPELDLLRSYEALIDDVVPGERSVVAKINTAAVDRYRTVIDPMGADLESYRKNPVVLWEHGTDVARGALPVGRNVWVKPRKAEKDLIAKTVFNDDEFSRSLFELYKSGCLRSFSVRALAGRENCSPPTPAEIRARPELAECEWMYRSWELLEYSSVAVPGNQEALALAVSRGLWIPDAIRSTLPPSPPTTPPPVIELPPFPQKPELPAFAGRRLADAVEARRAAIRAQADDVRARLELRRGIV